jgi:hypothetical protein
MIGIPMGEEISPPASPDVMRLKFLMRSGNAFMVDGVIESEGKWENGRCKELRLKQSTDPKYASVLVPSIDLSQIEAVVILPASGPGRRANEKEGGRG